MGIAQESPESNGVERLTDDDLVEWFLNPAIEETDAGVVNQEPLLVNTAGSLRYRPEAQTELSNFVVASDYVRTNTDLASMEAANEAARRAVNAILRDSGVRASECEIWELKEPAVSHRNFEGVSHEPSKSGNVL